MYVSRLIHHEGNNMPCNTCHGRAVDRNGVCQCARDIGALVDTMHQSARALDPTTGTNPANIVELFRIVNRYNAAMAAVDCITRPTK